MKTMGICISFRNILGRTYPLLLLILGLAGFIGADFAHAQSRRRPPVGRPGRDPGRTDPGRGRDPDRGREPDYGNRPGRRPIPISAPRDRRDVYDTTAYYLVRDAVAERDCSQLSEMLDTIADRVTLASYMRDDEVIPPGDSNEAIRRRMAARIRQRIRHPRFHRALWDRVADAYSGCGMRCFDQGYAMGQISAVGWCYAAIELGGLPADGSWPRPPQMACDHLQWSGCQSAYQATAQQVPGCRMFAESPRYRGGFLDAMNLDCRM